MPLDMPARAPLPQLDPMMVSEETASRLFNLVCNLKPSMILELGSGYSTICMAYALEVNGFGGLVAMEEGLEYQKRTSEWLRQHQLLRARVVHAPLVCHDPGGFLWYDDYLIQEARYDLVFVDGPDGAGIRRPAMARLKHLLWPTCTVVADDANQLLCHGILDEWERIVPGFAGSRLYDAGDRGYVEFHRKEGEYAAG